MVSTMADTVHAAEAPRNDSGTDTTTRTRRSRASSDEESNGKARYFLGKTSGTDGTPTLERELASEARRSWRPCAWE